MTNPWIYRLRHSNKNKLSSRNSSQNMLPALNYDDGHFQRVKVEFFTNENTFKERLQIYFLQNQKTSLQIRIFNLVIKLLSCILYVVRVLLDQNPDTLNECMKDQQQNNETSPLDFCKENSDYIFWPGIFWVNRNVWLWIIQVTVAIISLAENLLVTYISYKGNITQQILAPAFLLEALNTIPFIITIFIPPIRNLFVPVFLNCWLAKIALNDMMCDLHRVMQKSQSALSQQLVILIATITCLVFTSICGIQHLQRGSMAPLGLFDSLWFVIVTFSTVGYGDFAPSIWPSKLFMMILICMVFIVLPSQFEQLAYTWMEKQKMGGSYSSHRAQNEKHVVVVTTNLHADTILDFLNEFYAHPKVQDYFVVLLSPSELDPTMKLILQVPIWAARVIYIKGSALKDTDLSRCRMQDAEACFIIAARNYTDKAAADQHTILRSWAVKDFAPQCPQYVQIFRPDSKLHVHFAEHVVCEDEFKYALLANNCLFPGISTLVTLLLHTSRGEEGQNSNENWMRLYGKCSGNEIYHIKLGDSRFFGEYKGKSFSHASFHAHRKYGVSLVGIRKNESNLSILLNPGPLHVMEEENVCFYMSITKEENSALVLSTQNSIPESFGSSLKKKSIKFFADKRKRVLSSPDGNVVIEVDEVEDQKNRPKMMHQHSSPGRLKSPLLSSQSVEDPNVKLKSENKEFLHPEDVVIKEEILEKKETPTSSPHFKKSKTIAFSDLKKMEGEEESLGGSSKQTRKNKNKNKTSAPNLPLTIHKSYAKPANLASEENSTSELDNYEEEEDKENNEAHTKVTEKQTKNGLTIEFDNIYCGFPPMTPYIGTSPNFCYLVKPLRPLCCLQLHNTCKHNECNQASDYHWPNRCIIVAADHASNALYNFIVPLRSYSRLKEELNPIVLLLEEEPDSLFLDTVRAFPFVYWMIGNIENLEDLFMAGIHLADSMVVVNKESSNAGEEDTLSDCNTIVAVQSMFRLFPNTNIVTELSQASNMRFTQFRAGDNYALQLSKYEKKEKARGSHLYYMFRLPFAGGNVFTSSMLDTLLYQTYVKDYLIKFVRLLLGIDQADGSGHLSCIFLNDDAINKVKTYGQLYHKLCFSSHQIPIGLFRTEAQSRWNMANIMEKLKNPNFEEKDIEKMVRCRFSRHGLIYKGTNLTTQDRESISYVIINPEYDCQLCEEDIVYVINPYSLAPQVEDALEAKKPESSS